MHMPNNRILFTRTPSVPVQFRACVKGFRVQGPHHKYPKPYTLNLKPKTLNDKPYTLTPKL